MAWQADLAAAAEPGEEGMVRPSGHLTLVRELPVIL